MERKIGISIYPEQSSFNKDKEYLEKAAQLGFKIMFTSALHFVNDPQFEIKINKVLDVIKYAKSLGFYTILDVESLSLQKMKIDSELIKLKEVGVDCIRLDTPLRASEIAQYTFNDAKVDIQLNMSSNDCLIDEIMDFKPIVNRLNGCHNFYPLKYTALPFTYFEACNKRFLNHRLETSAFIASHVGEMTTAVGWKELPTLEMQRELSIKAQAKILFYTNQIDNVLVGNAYADISELEELSSVEREVITFDLKPLVKLTPGEKELLTSKHHFRRGDITEYFIRSTMTRVYFKDLDIQPQKEKFKLSVGDVVLINNNDVKYKGEVHIILNETIIDNQNKYNLIGKIDKDEMFLLNYLEPNTHFQFKLI